VVLRGWPESAERVWVSEAGELLAISGYLRRKWLVSGHASGPATLLRFALADLLRVGEEHQGLQAVLVNLALDDVDRLLEGDAAHET
jgi:hypothetical protein